MNDPVKLSRRARWVTVGIGWAIVLLAWPALSLVAVASGATLSADIMVQQEGAGVLPGFGFVVSTSYGNAGSYA